VTTVRRLLFPFHLARSRFSRRAGGFALVALGLAAAAAILAAVLAGSLVAQDRSVGRAVAELPDSARAVRAVWFGVPGQAGRDRAGLDRLARDALRRVSDESPIPIVLYRRTSIGGALVDLGAIDDLGRWVKVLSGRLPHACRPERCEVVQLAGRGPIPRIPSLRLVVVGKGALTSDTPFGDFIDPGTYHQPATPPLLVAEGVEGVVGARELDLVYRSYAWVIPLGPGSVHPWEVRTLDDRVAQARSLLQAEETSFDLAAPVSEIDAAGEKSRAAGRRLLLIGGQATALLLAFALLAAVSMRRDAEAARRRLTWFGARRWQLELLTGIELLTVALVGTSLGWLLGAVISAAIATEADSPPGEVLRHSVLSGGGIAAALALTAASAAILFLAVRARPFRLGGHSLSPLDVAALGALVAVVVALARGTADPTDLAREGGTGVVLLLLPGLVAFVAAVAFARALLPALRALERGARRAAVPLRLAALSLARHPGHAAIAIAFLTVSLGLALFAEGYRSTLARGQRDQAAYTVPTAVLAREDLRELVKPLDAAPLSRFQDLAPEIEPYPVLRLFGNVPRLAGSSGATVLGVPASELPSLDSWRDDFAPRPVAELATRIASRRTATPRGIPLADEARALLLPVLLRGHSVGLTASIATPDGRFVTAELGRAAPDRRTVLRATVPAEARGGRVVALTFAPPRRIEDPGAAAGRAARGVLTAGRLRVVGAGSASFGFEDWIPTSPGISAIVAGAQTDFHFALTNQVVSRFRPRQASDEGPVPVLATPRLVDAAGPGGVLSVDLTGETLVVRIVGSIERFPTIDGDAVVGDEQLVATALNADRPGSALPSEVWIDAPTGGAARTVTSALARPPFDQLEVVSREGVERSLRGDPLARAALITLASAAAVSLALALVGLVLGVGADLRDERGEFFDLEAQGADPATLRRQVRLRALIVAGVGLVGGIATGAVLSVLVVDLVRLTANAAAPEPPLLLAIDWPVVLLAVGGYAALAVALVLLVTLRAFRASGSPARVPELGV
jgi:hypothetical protein